MRLIAIILIILLLGLSFYGYYKYRGFLSQIAREERAALKLRKEIFSLYEERLEKIQKQIDSLKKSLETKGLELQLRTRKEIAELENQLALGKKIIRELQETNSEIRTHNLYRLCTEIYQNVKSKCDVLIERTK